MLVLHSESLLKTLITVAVNMMPNVTCCILYVDTTFTLSVYVLYIYSDMFESQHECQVHVNKSLLLLRTLLHQC